MCVCVCVCVCGFFVCCLVLSDFEAGGFWRLGVFEVLCLYGFGLVIWDSGS